MLIQPQKGIIRVQSNCGSGPAVGTTAVTTSGTASVKGTPAELISATAFDAFWMTVVAYAYGATNVACNCCLDILAGAATEDVLIPNLLAGECGSSGWNNAVGPVRWDFPLYVPAGTRIAAQAAGERLNANVYVQVFLYGGWSVPGFKVGSRVTTYGVGTVPNGTAFTPGATTYGAWAEIAAATSRDHFAFVLSVQKGAAQAGVVSGWNGVELGIGAATEQSLLGQWIGHSYATTDRTATAINSVIYANVPSGTRLVVRGARGGSASGRSAAVHALS